LFGEYKIIAYALIGLFLFGLGTAAVLTYNHAIAKAAEQEQQIRLRDQIINDQQQIVADKIREAEAAKKYQAEADQRRIITENEINKILSMETKRDEEGNITANDPVLHALNGMYPTAPDGKSSAQPAARASVPKDPAPAGGLAVGKEILPE
jgi:hypothetical protein